MKDNQESGISTGDYQGTPESDRPILTARHPGTPYKGHVDLEYNPQIVPSDEDMIEINKNGEYRGVYVGPWNRMTQDGRCEVLIGGKWTDSREIDDYSKLVKNTMHYQCRVRGE